MEYAPTAVRSAQHSNKYPRGRGFWSIPVAVTDHGQYLVTRAGEATRFLALQHCATNATNQSARLGDTWPGGRSTWACGGCLGAEIRALASPQLPQVTKMTLGSTISTWHQRRNRWPALKQPCPEPRLFLRS